MGEVRAGKVIELEVAESDPAKARATGEEMGRRLLANTGDRELPRECGGGVKAGIVLFPGINRERDMAIALERSSGQAPRMILGVTEDGAARAGPGGHSGRV